MTTTATAYDPWSIEGYTLQQMRVVNDHIEDDLRYIREYDKQQQKPKRTLRHLGMPMWLFCALLLLANSWEQKNATSATLPLTPRVTLEHHGVQIIADEGKCAPNVPRGTCATLSLIPSDLPNDPTLKIVSVTPWVQTSALSVERRERLEYLNGDAAVSWRIASEHVIE